MKLRRGAAAGCAVLVLSGCSSVPSLPELGLPGSTVDGFQVTARFADALDLVPLSAVKLDGVRVGIVTDVRLGKGMVAEAVLQVHKGLKVPADVRARIAQTSLLGEKYVELIRPVQSAAPPLSQGAVIPLDRTGAAVEVEDLLSAASALLNGGGLGHLQTISRELNTALSGRDEQVHVLLRNLDQLLGGIEENKQDIVRALDAMDRLSGTLAAQRDTIGAAIEQLPAGVAALANQQADLTRALTALSDLGRVADRVIGKTQKNVVADLKLLDPVLTQIAKAAPSFFSTIDTLLTYPFARNIYGGVAGDYVSLSGELEIDLDSLAGDTLKPGPSYADPNPQIACGEYGSNCRPGTVTAAPPKATASGPRAPRLGRDLLEALGQASR
ncbi:MAG: MCE family protein [Mycobacteriales bacterium]